MVQSTFCSFETLLDWAIWWEWTLGWRWSLQISSNLRSSMGSFSCKAFLLGRWNGTVHVKEALHTQVIKNVVSAISPLRGVVVLHVFLPLWSELAHTRHFFLLCAACVPWGRLRPSVSETSEKTDLRTFPNIVNNHSAYVPPLLPCTMLRLFSSTSDVAFRFSSSSSFLLCY